MEGFDDGLEEGDDEEGVSVVAVIGVGGFRGVDYAVHSEDERFRVGDEGVEAPRDGPASEEGFDVGDGVEDQENHRVRELIEAVHFS